MGDVDYDAVKRCG